MGNLKNIESHFEFGKNWASFSKLINPERIKMAEDSLLRLIPADQIKGKTFLDIGCGSGLFSLVALRLGAKSVCAIDIDPFSCTTTTQTLQKFWGQNNWSVENKSIFDMTPQNSGSFDIVYSWGVLHHTGNMYEAIRNAAALVNKNGLLVLALYRKTKLCEAWKIEKKIYTKAPGWLKFFIRNTFKAAVILDLLRARKNPLKVIKSYDPLRGMDWSHDIEDWIGGYPYESILPSEMNEFAKKLEFEPVQAYITPPGLGFFGSGNDEFVFRRLS